MKSPSQHQADARYHYRKWAMPALLEKRRHMANTFLALEDVCRERGLETMSARTREELRILGR